jgi:hypothetical protein
MATTFAFCAVMAHGQWVGYKVNGVPRTADGKPKLNAPVPRVSSRPDLSGIWSTVPAKYNEANDVVPGVATLAVPGDDPATMSKYFFSAIADYKVEEIMKPAGLAKWRSGAPPANPCSPISPPMSDLIPLPRRVVQTPKLIVFLSEGFSPRQIHMDGRPLPTDPQPAYLGYSVGKWEGDVLVIETIGITDKTPLDGMGHPRSEAARLTERVRRRDYGHLEVQVIFDDPQYYMKPVTYRYTQELKPDDDLLEIGLCTENEKDAQHMRPPGPQ